MSNEALNVFAIGFAIVLVAMFALGLMRGRKVQATNEQIAANQKRQIELHERQVAALERIAAAAERRAGS